MDLVHHDHPIRVIGRYALYGKLASGGMATVHFGRLLGPAGFSRTVAIKRLHPQFAKDPEFVAMFLDEARLAARIQHPNVVATVDVVAMQEELFLVMDYIRGESFSKLMRASRKRQVDVSLGVIASIIAGMLLGLHAAHEARDERGQPLSVVHRDVSPQNVLVGVDGVARVLDFGVAKAAARIQITRDGQMKGKLAYMAPEQLQGKVVDRRTDIFAAGIVLWEALTGRRLFDAEEASELLRMVVSEEIPPPSAVVPSIARAIDDIVMKALSRDPAKRYETARQFAIALEEAAPLASPREVGEWVELVAGDTLNHREQAVAEIEAVSSVSDVSFNTGSVPGFSKTHPGTSAPNTVPDALKPWDDDPTRISTNTLGSSTTGKNNPTRIQVPRPLTSRPPPFPPGSSSRPPPRATTSRPPPLPNTSRPPPILGPEHIGFGALLDDEVRTNVIASEFTDESPTSLYFPPEHVSSVPDGTGSVPFSRAIVVRERTSMPPTIMLHETIDPNWTRSPSMLGTVRAWLWDDPEQRTWRVAAAAGTLALLLGFGVVAGLGGRQKPTVRMTAVPGAPVAAARPADASPRRGVDPASLPLADDAPRKTSAAKDAPAPPTKEGAASASSKDRVVIIREISSLPLEPPSEAKAADLLDNENPYAAALPPHAPSVPGPRRPAPTPAPPATVASKPPPEDKVPPGCRQPYIIDPQGIRRVKPECL